MILRPLAVACIFFMATGASQAQQKGRVSVLNAQYHISAGMRSVEEYKTCEPLDTIAAVKKLCDGKATCRVPVANQTFGKDPCVKADKQLMVSWSCDGKGEDYITGRCEEYQQMTLMCPAAGVRWDQASICTDDPALDIPAPQ